MTAAALSAFQLRAGAAIVRKLANATADFGGGVVVEGILRRDAVASLGLSTSGMFARDIILRLVESDIVTVDPKRDTLLDIAGETYRVLGSEKDLEHGVRELALEKVQP